MYQRFKDFINTENLLDENDRVLLGISGGLDSMVMLNLFLETGYSLAVAHCNFGLRGEESDQDQLFVAGHCKKYNIPLYTKLFDTQSYANERGVSVQMAARDLRYAWFNKLLS